MKAKKMLTYAGFTGGFAALGYLVTSDIINSVCSYSPQVNTAAKIGVTLFCAAGGAYVAGEEANPAYKEIM